MKKLIFAAALLSPLSASASDYSPVFNLGGPLAPGVSYTQMALDIPVHKRVMAVNGVLRSANGVGSPLSGTCQFSNTGGVFCILQNGFISLIVDLGPNLSGTMRAQDGDGNTFSTLTVTYAGME